MSTRDGLAGIGLYVLLRRLRPTRLLGPALVLLIIGKVWWDGLPLWKRAVVLLALVALIVWLTRRRRLPRRVPVPAAAPTEQPPELGYVYRYYDEQGVLLYVGSTGHIERRTAEHARDRRPWARPGVTMTVETLPTREAAYDVEAVAIRQEHPLYNIAGAA